MYLFFDTETTGLPKDWKAPVSNVTNWPRLVQIAWLYYDDKGTLLSEGNYIIKPDGFIIPKDATKVHGISTERAIEEGVELRGVLNDFDWLATHAGCLVAHNMSFDEKIMGAEFIRAKMPDTVAKKKKICTMHASTGFCRIPGPYGLKWPKLSELHYKLFNAGFDEAHNAAVDIQVTAKCFWEMRKLGVI